MHQWYDNKIEHFFNLYQTLIEEGKTKEALAAFYELNNYKAMKKMVR